MRLLLYLFYLLQQCQYHFSKKFGLRATWSFRKARRTPPAAKNPFPRTRRKPQWVINAIIKMAGSSGPGTDCRTLQLRFNRLYTKRGMTVSKSWVSNTLRKHCAAVAQLHEHYRRHVPPPMARNVVWGIDLTGVQDAEGKVHIILGIIDHGTRRLVRLLRIEHKSSWQLLSLLFSVIDACDQPKALRTDNERCFTSRTFTIGLKLLGIRHQRTELGCPWQNGRIERLFGTLKEKLNNWPVANGEQLDTALEQFATWYNVVRPHQHLDGCTPQEVWDKVDIKNCPPKSVTYFCAWDGLLTGEVLRR